MSIVILLCIPTGLAIHVLLVRPFLRPLTERIPTERKYRPTLGAKVAQ